MTLQEWIDNGGNMLSDYTTARLCNTANISENQLRAMPLVDIFAMRTIEGDVHEGKHLSQRELMRFWREHPNQLTSSARLFAYAHLNT